MHPSKNNGRFQKFINITPETKQCWIQNCFFEENHLKTIRIHKDIDKFSN